MQGASVQCRANLCAVVAFMVKLHAKFVLSVRNDESEDAWVQADDHRVRWGRKVGDRGLAEPKPERGPERARAMPRRAGSGVQKSLGG